VRGFLCLAIFPPRFRADFQKWDPFRAKAKKKSPGLGKARGLRWIPEALGVSGPREPRWLDGSEQVNLPFSELPCLPSDTGWLEITHWSGPRMLSAVVLQP